jgi:hypothetical protein
MRLAVRPFGRSAARKHRHIRKESLFSPAAHGCPSYHQSHMLKLSLKSILLTLVVCLGWANAPAQEPQMMPPPLSGFSTVPIPGPNSLGPPPPLEWSPLPSAPPGGQSGTISLPDSLFVSASESTTVFAPETPSNCAIFVNGQSDPALFQLVTPRIEIWRSGAEAPELPIQIKEGLQYTLIAPGNPIWVRLLFDPSLTGTTVAVTASDGVVMQPAASTIQIGPSGECLFTVDIIADLRGNAEIIFDAQQVTTGLRLTPAPAEVIGELGNP